MRKRTKIIAIAAASVILAGTATGAFAYWIATGSGGGTALTASAPVGLTVNQDEDITQMGPGDTAQTLSGTFDNAGSPSYVDSVTVSIASVDAGGGTCDSTDYTLLNPTMTVGSEVPSGAVQGSWSGATIQFNDKPDVDQSGCEGATVYLSYVVS